MLFVRFKQILLSTLFFVLITNLLGQSVSSQKADSLLRIAASETIRGRFSQSDSILKQIDYEELREGKAAKHFIFTSKLNAEEELTYREYYDFSSYINTYGNISSLELADFILYSIPRPSGDTIPGDYIVTLWSAMSIVRNQLSLDSASNVANSLEAYFKQFEQDDAGGIRAQVLLLNHDFVLAQISGNNVDLMGTIHHNIDSLAQIHNDSFLLAFSEHCAMELYTVRRDLPSFLEAGERCLEIANTSKSAIHFKTTAIDLLLNGYMYQATNYSRIQELFEEYKTYQNISWQIYLLHAQYIGMLPMDSKEQLELYREYNASNMGEFLASLTAGAQRDLSGIDLANFYETLAYSMIDIERAGLAYKYQQKANEVNKAIFTDDMAKNIAQVETEYALKAKNAELDNERERQKMYQKALLAGAIIVAFLMGLLFFIRKQNSQLSQKNKEIEAQRNKLEKSEREISLLLKEVHHRVKNNFQIVSSLLELQFRNVSDEQTQTLLQEGKNRVQSMAFIHQQLYQNDQLHIHLNEYVPKLVSELARIYGGESIESIIQIEKDISLDIDTAIPVGLILNELINNAMKYGFSETKKQLTIRLDRKKPGEYLLSVSDSGRGLPANFSLESANSMGLRLVKRLTKQLLGSVAYSSEEGCTFYIEFKDTIARNKVD
jgi:two-component sensor histidine kinase